MKISNAWSRRSFLKFIGASSALSATGCTTPQISKKLGYAPGLDLATKEDDVNLGPGLSYDVLIREGEAIGRGLFFGTNNDYLNLYDFKNGKFGLWINHESLSPILLYGRQPDVAPTKNQITFERSQLGGSFIEVKKDNTGKWIPVKNSKLNFKVSGNTRIPLSHPINGRKTARGTLANCAGGFTPWGTILTCEENYHHFYGEADFSSGKRKIVKDKRDFGWLQTSPEPTENYGWVVEVDPRTKKSEKIIPLGRFAHECATVGLTNDGYPVVYTGDDSENEFLYKFISTKKDSLKEGTLYVADVKKGEWRSLSMEDSPILKEKFKDQTEVYIRAREAARLLKASPLDRPEDIQIDPLTGAVFVTLTNNKPKGNFHGSILKIVEKDKADLNFKSSTFRAGGTRSGFSCPDNLAFDQNGNLWMTSDISGGSIGKSPYKKFGNNGLFVIPRRGGLAGKVIKMGSAPNDAEFTGPYFSPDQKTLFLAVQHPGEKTKEYGKYTSNWPSGKKGEKPLSSVITIQGDALNFFTQKT